MLMIEGIKQVRRNILGSLRYWTLRLCLLDIRVGKRFFCLKPFYLARSGRLRVGDDVYIGRNAHFASRVKMGNAILIASNVSFVGGDHKIDGIGDTKIKFSGREHDRETIIEDNVWVGHGCIIMAGVRISEGAVVAAGSIVTKDVEKNAVVVGAPAKFLRYRKP